MEHVKIILDATNLESEIKELKLSYLGDTFYKHTIIDEDGYIIIEMKAEEKYTCDKHVFYGKQIKDKIYIGRVQYIESVHFDPIDVYGEFISTGTVLA